MGAHQLGEMAVESLTGEDLAGLLMTVEAREVLVVGRVACQQRSVQCGVRYPPLCGCATVSSVMLDRKLGIEVNDLWLVVCF